MSIHGLAYGKINLGLRIHGKREDGYHDIETIFHRIHLSDRLEFARAEDISIECAHPEVPTDERNICYKAARLLQEATGIQTGVHIRLQKNIPVGAGLGGGSADAALVLRMLPSLWNKPISQEVCYSIAAQLGSDVPFFLGGSSAYGRGRGELLESHTLTLPFTVVVCFPGTIVSTKDAYAHVRDFNREDPGRLWKDFELFLRNKVGCRCLGNDFEPVVFRAYPEIGVVKELLLKQGARCAFLSGSGSAVYGLFDETGPATQAAEMLRGQYPLVHLTPPRFVPPAEHLLS